MPAKAIPPHRNRLQSKLLVWIAIPILCYLTFGEFKFLLQTFSLDHGHLSMLGLLHGHFIASEGRYDNRLAQIMVTSIIFALSAWRLRAATPMAAVVGGLICFLISTSAPAVYSASVIQSGLTPLLLLFVFTFWTTRMGRGAKELSGLSESRSGRSAAQVIANLGIAAFLSPMMGYSIAYRFGWFGEYAGSDEAARTYFAIPMIPMLAALAEATADTVSSEIGQAFGGSPILLTTLRRVPRGTDGAISLYGTFAGIAAAALIAATGIPALGMSPGECLVAFAAGVVGLFFDSLLGATLERKGWINNDLVNFSSTTFAATLALLAIRLLSGKLLP
jgi:uncharacterized protein (TIGR00297 family)